jgi:hypothetical protein
MQIARNKRFLSKQPIAVGTITAMGVAIHITTGMSLAGVGLFIGMNTKDSPFFWFNLFVIASVGLSWAVHCGIASPYSIEIHESFFKFRRLTSFRWNEVDYDCGLSIEYADEMINGSSCSSATDTLPAVIYIRIPNDWHLRIQRGYLSDFECVVNEFCRQSAESSRTRV